MRMQRAAPDRAQLLVGGARERGRAGAHAGRGHPARGALRQVRRHPPPAARHPRLPAQAADAAGPPRRRLPRPPHTHAAGARLTNPPPCPALDLLLTATPQRSAISLYDMPFYFISKV